MRRKKKQEEHSNHERWLVSYADFITLLFAFFVVLFAASKADEQKAGRIAKAVEVAFSELALFDPSSKAVPLYDDGGLSSDDATGIIGSVHSGFARGQLVWVGDAKIDIEAVREHLESMLGEELAKGQVRMNIDERGLTISLAEAGFFDPGSAVIQRAALPVVDRIAEKLRDLPWDLRIEGHTDNIPIKTASFPRTGSCQQPGRPMSSNT